jgi:hypothetical protein
MFVNKLLYIIFIFFCASSFTANAQQIDSVMIKGRLYIGKMDTSGFFLLDQNADTILNLHLGDFFSFKFQDFNKDGYQDILFEWPGNTPERYTLYEFVPETNKFRKVIHFSDFPVALSIKGTKYYYSYESSGCADDSWESRLFYIHNHIAIKLGHIHGDGCGIQDGIYIYRCKADKEYLIKTMPLNTLNNYSDKWEFIKAYWNKNYKKFLK